MHTCGQNRSGVGLRGMFEKTMNAVKAKPKRAIFLALILAAALAGVVSGDVPFGTVINIATQIMSDTAATGDLPDMPLPTESPAVIP